MTLFQHFAKWSLRVVAAWVLVEGALNAYDWGLARYAQFSLIAGQSQAISRLDAEALRLNDEALTLEQATSRTRPPAWHVTPEQSEGLSAAASRQLRAAMIEFGAQAPVVEPMEQREGADHAFTLRWREATDRSPAVLDGLAQRFPALRVRNLTLQRGDLVNSEAIVNVRLMSASGGDAE